VDRPIELIPLVCLNCSTPIPADKDEMAWVCAQCGQGMALDVQQGLTPLQVHYTEGILPNTRGKPYWVSDGQVALQRDVYRSSGKSSKEAGQFWSSQRRFLIPAYTLSQEDLLAQTARFLLQPPVLKPGPLAQFEPVTLSMEDIQPVAEFIVMAIEAGRKDVLKNIQFTLELSLPSLWILP
jgi:hypothetical protein